MSIQAQMIKLADVLASGRFTEAAAIKIATLTKLGIDALLAHGATEEYAAAQVFPAADYAIAFLAAKAAAQ